MKADLFSETVLRMKRAEDISDVLYLFELDDGYYIQRVSRAIRDLLRREDLTPKQVHSIAKMLLGLERLPLQTPGLNVSIELYEKVDGEATSYEIAFGGNEFRTASGGYVEGSMGSDSFSGPTFEVGQQFRSCDVFDISDLYWPQYFSDLSVQAKLRIEDNSDDELLDWEHSNGLIFWVWIESHPDRNL